MRRTTDSGGSERWELSEEDFDAVAASRATLKKRLTGWLRGVASRLAEEGVDFDVSAGDPHLGARDGSRVDAQSASLFRRGRSRPGEPEPERGQAHVELRVDPSGASLALRLGGDARADLELAAARLALAPAELAAAWEALPDTVGIEARGAPSGRARGARDVSPRAAAQLVRRALDSGVPVVVGVRLSRAAALAPRGLGAWSELAFRLAKLLAALVEPAEPSARVSDRRPSPSRARPEGKAGSAPSIARGARVRALSGPFAGQDGVVQELDGKGGARVLFGLLAARVELGELVPKGKERGRPRLSSSHRKPST